MLLVGGVVCGALWTRFWDQSMMGVVDRERCMHSGNTRGLWPYSGRRVGVLQGPGTGVPQQVAQQGVAALHLQRVQRLPLQQQPQAIWWSVHVHHGC